MPSSTDSISIADVAGEEAAAGFVQLGERDLHAPTLHFGPMAKPVGEKLIVDNRRARHDYHLSDRVEAGLVLAGTEVKALRDGKATLQQAYADVREGEAWLVGLHIPEYGQGNRANHEPDRPRKLLMHRREIDRLYAQVREKGFTLDPDPALLQGRAREGGDRARPRQGAARQAARRRRPGREAADRARAQVAPLRRGFMLVPRRRPRRHGP